MAYDIQTLDGTELPDELRNAFRQLTSQVLIVLAKRAGGRLVIPVSEVDNTEQDLLEFKHEGANFTFTHRRKS